MRGSELAELLGPREWSSWELADGLRRLVLNGHLAAGTRLPAERELSDALGVSRTLLARALDLLRTDGFVASRRGAYSWITLPPDGGSPEPEGELINLAQAVPPAPVEIGAALDAARPRMAEKMSSSGYKPRGLLALRERIAARFDARGLPTSPDQIMVTNGAQNAFVHVLRTLLHEGGRVLVEDPTYPNALRAIEATARAVPVPMTESGWDIPSIEAVVKQATPGLAYLVLDFQNPTGFRMEAEQREQLAAVLRRTRTLAVVDETLVEVDLSGRTAPPPMASFAPERVITTGSASKSFWGGLRMGWIRAPEPVVDRLVRSQAAMDLGSPFLEQFVLVELLADPEPLLRRRRAEWIACRDALAAALREHLPSWEFQVPDGGLSLWCDLGEPIASRLAVAAEQHGVRVAPGGQFGVDSAVERHVRLPYTLPVEDLHDAVRRLALAARGLGTAPGPGAREAPVA